MRSAWEELLNSRDAVLFVNPLYCPSEEKIDLLSLQPSIPNLQIWLQAYCRHIPVLEIIGGGTAQVKYSYLYILFIFCIYLNPVEALRWVQTITHKIQED